ncbi:MAG: hypothetical protein AB1505_09770 [Candidatus Latescibacterota bacterium]
METTEVKDSRALVGFPVRLGRMPAFSLTGFTRIVTSGGEQYALVRADGRWEVLRRVGGTIYGVASSDRECPKDHYRYTLGVQAPASQFGSAVRPQDLFTLQVRQSEWLVFELEHFGRQYGHFWGADPYAMTQKLGWAFNARVGLHIDVYAPSYTSDDDAMEFWMPVKQPRETR